MNKPCVWNWIKYTAGYRFTKALTQNLISYLKKKHDQNLYPALNPTEM